MARLNFLGTISRSDRVLLRTRLTDSSAALLIVFVAHRTIQAPFRARNSERIVNDTIRIGTKRVPHGAHLFELPFRELIHASIIRIIHAGKRYDW